MLKKRRSALADAQLLFSFDVPDDPADAGHLAGFGAMMAASVARMLREDPRPRAEIARAVSQLLGESVTKLMLDAYASEARDGHNVPAHRWWAVIVACDRFDVADAMAKRAGARVLSGEEIKAAELGHLQAQTRELQARIRELRGQVKPIARGRA